MQEQRNEPEKKHECSGPFSRAQDCPKCWPPRHLPDSDQGQAKALGANAAEGVTGQSQSEGKQLPHAAHYGASLAVAIEDDAVVIRCGVQTLAHAVTYADWANRWTDSDTSEDGGEYIREFAIIDVRQFAKDVIHEMLSEREDGSSPLSDFLDEMTKEATSQGSLGLHPEDVQIKHGEKHPLETW